MCGIVGYTGRRDAAPRLLEGLKRLEYRGYDSAGLAVANGGGVVVTKLAARVAALADQLGRAPLHGATRSEEHTSELQSHHDLVCRLLLEKKKQNRLVRLPT